WLLNQRLIAMGRKALRVHFQAAAFREVLRATEALRMTDYSVLSFIFQKTIRNRMNTDQF
ncbi:MAG TPA: hypothetical protein VJT08_18430, partial [Terriglobales bacterium]|nr:hypothetical protein [Terriglobales bacterium]